MPTALRLRSKFSAELELQFAKARFAEDYDCVAVKLAERTRPQVSTQATAIARDALVLRNARHPLLERDAEAEGARRGPDDR